MKTLINNKKCLNILIVSALGETQGAALRLTLDGHDVKFYVHAADSQDIGQNLVPRVKDWRDHVPWADLVWFDDVEQSVVGRNRYGGGQWADLVRKLGKPVVGGTALTDKLENDRMYGQKMCEQFGIDTVPMHRFTGFLAAERFVKQMGGGWAVKHQGQVDRNLNTVGFTPDEVMGFLRWSHRNWKTLAPGKEIDFVLQEAVKGVEIALTAFFNGTRFANSVYLNQEYKKLMDGDKGPATGQMGEMGQVQDLPDIFSSTLGHLEPWLAAQGFNGWIDLNTIATPSKIVPLEFTPRPGYPTLWSTIEALEGDLVEMLLWMAGVWPIEPTFTHDYIANVLICSGTWPEPDDRKNRGLQVSGIKEQGVKHAHLLSVQLDNDGNIMSAGPAGNLVDVTARGQDVDTARKMAYEIADAIKVTPYKIQRTDIGENFEDDWTKLKSWSWID